MTISSLLCTLAVVATLAVQPAAAQNGGRNAGIGIGVALLVILVIVLIYKGIRVVKEREVMIIQRLGSFSKVLTSGIHLLVPFVDAPKVYPVRYWITDDFGRAHLESNSHQIRISLQNEVMDFPKQSVITRDNASVLLDVILSYKITNPRELVYSVRNIPNVLSKTLQGQVRNVAGTLDVDQMIEDAGSLNVISGLMQNEVLQYGVHVDFVKVQRVETPGLVAELEKKKKADLNNRKIIIEAKTYKQTKVIESEGKRDSMIRSAEGESQQLIANAKGTAQATINDANAESKTITEVARAIGSAGEDPTTYLLTTKYLAALRTIVSAGSTDVRFLPLETAGLQTAQALGLNTVIPR